MNLYDKIEKVKRLLEGAKTEGERRASQAALGRLMAKEAKQSTTHRRSRRQRDSGYKTGFQWRTADGREIELKDLEDGHLANIINMLNRNLQCCDPWMKAYYQDCIAHMEHEWSRRHPYKPDYSDIDFEWSV